MTTIILVCPFCGNHLHTEDESRYFNNTYGCTINCDTCNKNLIGVDLSVCARCSPMKKERIRCKTKYCVLVKIKETIPYDDNDDVWNGG